MPAQHCGTGGALALPRGKRSAASNPAIMSHDSRAMARHPLPRLPHRRGTSNAHTVSRTRGPHLFGTVTRSPAALPRPKRVSPTLRGAADPRVPGWCPSPAMACSCSVRLRSGALTADVPAATRTALTRTRHALEVAGSNHPVYDAQRRAPSLAQLDCALAGATDPYLR